MSLAMFEDHGEDIDDYDDDEEVYENMDGIVCSQSGNDIAALVAAGEIHQCAGCGCTELTPCEGGCIWATPTHCSRCV